MRAARLTHMPHQIAERARRAASAARRRGAPEAHDCAACGRIGAGCFGFGGLPSVERSLWACDDPECRQRVESMAAERDGVAPAQAPHDADPVGDLFARSAP